MSGHTARLPAALVSVRQALRDPAVRHAARVRLAHGAHLATLSPRVALFYVRAWRTQRRLGDAFSFGGAIRPRDLATLLRAARGARTVVEVGTGTGWSAIALALAREDRHVLTIDPVVREQRERYLALAGDAAARITFVEGIGATAAPDVGPVDFVFIDAAHDEASTLAEFRAWRARLAPGGAIAFHDFADPQWPGVTEAIRALGLRGRGRHRIFVWQRP